MAHAVSGAAWGGSGGARERDVHPHTKTSRYSLVIFAGHFLDTSIPHQVSGITFLLLLRYARHSCHFETFIKMAGKVQRHAYLTYER